jgi:hypothetical protein
MESVPGFDFWMGMASILFAVYYVSRKRIDESKNNATSITS